MTPLANSKKISIFALRNLHYSVNHRIYRILHKRLGVVYLYSYYTVISGFRNFESITLSLYSILTKFKFFTNAKPSKRFSTREQEYLATNAQPSDRAKTTQHYQSIKKKELGAYPLLLSIRLLIREFYGYVRGIPAQVVQNLIKSIQRCHTIRTDQRQGVLWQRQNLFRGVSKSNENA